MTFTEILISFAVGVAANLLTPAIRHAAERGAVQCALRFNASGRKIAEVRLRQLTEERTVIESLHENPLKLAHRIAYFTAPQVVTLWIISAALLYALLSGNGQNLTHSAWSGAIFGLIGYASRFPIGALISLSELRKVSDIGSFRAQNSAAQAKVQALLVRNES